MNAKNMVKKLVLALLVVLLLAPMASGAEETYPLKLNFEEGSFSIYWEARLVDTWEIPAEPVMLVLSKVDESLLISLLVRGNYELLLWVDAQYADKISVSGELRALFVDASAKEWVTLEVGDDAMGIAITAESLAGLLEKSTYVPLFPGNEEDAGSTGTAKLPCGHNRGAAGDHSAAVCLHCEQTYYACDTDVAKHSNACIKCGAAECVYGDHSAPACGRLGHYECDPHMGPMDDTTSGHGQASCGIAGHYACSYQWASMGHDYAAANPTTCSYCGQPYIGCDLSSVKLHGGSWFAQEFFGKTCGHSMCENCTCANPPVTTCPGGCGASVACERAYWCLHYVCEPPCTSIGHKWFWPIDD